MKKLLMIVSSLVFGMSLALLVLLGGGSPLARADGADSYSVYHVAPSCAGVPIPCYTSVQAAVDAADAGELVKIAIGEYTDIHVRGVYTQVVYISKTVTLQGGYSTANNFADPPDPEGNPTTLNAQGAGRVIVVDGAGATIRGLIVTGANVPSSANDSGGGIYVNNGSATIEENQIIHNVTTGDGGGIAVNGGSAEIAGNYIFSNTASWGGGMRIINDADVTIRDNHIAENVGQIAGGGIDIGCCGGVVPLIERNVIINNRTNDRGGAVIVQDTDALLVNNILGNNQANRGAGVYLDGQSTYPVSITLLHNTLSAWLPGGEGIYLLDYATATLVNNIIANYTTGITNTIPASSSVHAEYTLFDNNGQDYGSGVTSLFEVGGVPDFRNPAGANYHLGLDSGAIDQAAFIGVVDDVDGYGRPIGSAPDVGADEVGIPTYLPLVMRSY